MVGTDQVIAERRNRKRVLASELGAQLAPEALAPLIAYEWLGNIRELRNTVTRMVVLPDSASPQAGRTRPASTLPTFCSELGRLRPWLEASAAGSPKTYKQ